MNWKTISFILFSAPLFSQNATTPGEVTTPYPTITNLSVEWKIAGDDNLNGRVTVQYREAGQGSWQEGLPLIRIPAGDSAKRASRLFSWENKHSGSLFDLKPGVEYEIRLRLDDPDGGSAERTARARTRNVPRPWSSARVKKVSPTAFAAAAGSAEPGDILQLSPGYYGRFTATRDGEPGKPIVIRGDVSHVIRSTFEGISLENRKHIILEKVTVNGSVELLGGEDLSVRYCTVNAQYGIIAKRPPGAKNCYIADNVVTYVMPWVPEGMGASSIWGGAGNVGEGIQMTGPGNVICHNRVKGFRDCISTMEDNGVHEQVSIDIYNNDIYVGADDGIEADFCEGNCRVMRNRLTNCFMGVSSQPSMGGPLYIVRNAMYNIIDAPFKLSRGSYANIILHNTALKVGDGMRMPHASGMFLRSVFRNNLCVGGPGGGKFGAYGSGAGLAIYTPNPEPTNDLDYNGAGAHQIPFAAQIGRERYASLEELRERTPFKHVIPVDLSVFLNVVFPNPPVPEREPGDLRLRPGSVAVDAGIRLPNINDGFAGAAPDLGAHELGAPIPHYGPRPEGVDEEKPSP